MTTKNTNKVQIIPALDGSGPLANYADIPEVHYRLYFLRKGLVPGLSDNLLSIHPIKRYKPDRNGKSHVVITPR